MSDLTAVVLTKNEESYIADCLDSLSWCDSITVFDSLSADHTIEIASQFGVKVILHSFQDFASQHNAALDVVNTEWVLFVDADERISPQLAAEISAALNDQDFNGYWIPTHNYQMGRLFLHAGLYPDYHLRLFRKQKGHYDPAQKVHERVILEGAAGYLKNPLIHLSCETWQDFEDHQARYAKIKAEGHFERGVRPSYHFIAGPILEFLHRYLVLQGFRDGLHGLRLSWIFAYYNFVMYVELSKLWRARSRIPAR